MDGKTCTVRRRGEAAEKLNIDNALWLPDGGTRMTAQLSYDEDAIYVHMTAAEKNIRAELTGELCPVWEDSCMEFFFRPEGDDHYVNLEINPNGSFFLGFGRGRADRIRLAPDAAPLCIRTAVTETGWELDYRIPAALLRTLYGSFPLAPGLVLRANLYKCADKSKTPHYLSWSPVTSETPDFHRPCDFGTLVFA